MTTALQILIIVTLIGIIGGLAISRHGRGRFMTRAGGFTAAFEVHFVVRERAWHRIVSNEVISLSH